VTAIDQFVERLATADALPNVVNPYAYACTYEEANAARRENLRHYLDSIAATWLLAAGPTIMLIGEAPGYRGCRVTGVPFTNAHLLLNGLPGLSDPGFLRSGFHVVEGSESGYPAREATAAIMWRALQSFAILPLLWNAFPFHPHQPGQPLSNRRPARRELDIGAVYLIQLLEVFKPERVVAVGNCAGESLARLGIFHHKVRHPSHGGKQAFMAQLRPLLSDTPERDIRVDS
jgi:uracil-DNA glycosylase